MSTVNLEAKRGDTWYWEFPILQADGETPQNITGATFRFTAKYRVADGDGAAAVSGTSAGGQCVITNAAGGLMTVKIPTSQTGAITPVPTTLAYDLQVQDSGGNVYTPYDGEIAVSADVSITVP